MPLFLTIILLLLLLVVCAYLVLIILMQRASSNSGMGSALGGGAAESALGGGATTVLTKGTIGGTAIFFILCFVLYLGFINHSEKQAPHAKTSSELLQAAQRDATANSDTQPAAEAPTDAAAPQQKSSLVEFPAVGDEAASQPAAKAE